MHDKIVALIKQKYGEVEFTRLGDFKGQECYKVLLAKDEDWLADDYYLLFNKAGDLVKTIFAGDQFVDEETEETKLAKEIEEVFRDK